LSSFLSGPARVSLLKWAVKRHYRAPLFVFPIEFGSSLRVLVILPQDPLEALHQLSCIVSMTTHFKAAHLVVLCERRVTPLFKGLGGISEIIDYDRAEWHLFSKEFEKIGKEIRNSGFDVCLMLDSKPDLALLYTAGKSAASVRIGVRDTGEYPFLNLHVIPASERIYLTDRGLLVAAMLGVPERPKAHWSVSKDSVEEVGLMLSEMKIAPSSRLVGIDGLHFYKRHGRQWTQALVDMLRKKPCMCYFFSYDEPHDDALEWLNQQDIPSFSNLSVSRSAALIYKSELVVTGATVLFELADLLRKPAVGVFEDGEYPVFCRESGSTKGLRYLIRPDEVTLESIERCLDAFTFANG
jgi:ADP-heptose:LPS heptosyltransferase